MALNNDNLSKKKNKRSKKSSKLTSKKQLKSDVSYQKQISKFEDNDDDYDEFMQQKDSLEKSKDNESKLSRNESIASSPSSLSETNFFYTSDKFFNTFEDDEITYYIQCKYPTFDFENSNDIVMRKTIIEILNDTKFITEVLDRYNMNIYDFFKFLFRYDQNIFKGLFFKRIRKALKYKKYATTAKKLLYSERKHLSKKLQKYK